MSLPSSSDLEPNPSPRPKPPSTFRIRKLPNDPVHFPTDAPPAESAPEIIPPQLNGYQIEKLIGRGGMGVVFKARHVVLNRVVAVKMAPNEMWSGSREFMRFLVEAEAIAAVRHPNVVQVYEYGDESGRPYLTMEYLAGGSLADRLSRCPVGIDEAALLLEKLARATEAAHRQGIIHRDLKPGNVLFDDHGEPKISDFGLAKFAQGSDITHTQAILGTPGYMSPEQAKGDTKFVGPTADIWALGIILYEMLAGHRPFAGDDHWNTLREVMGTQQKSLRAINPEIPRDLELICWKCLEKDPRDRYQTALELAEDLRRFILRQPVSVRSPSPIELAFRWAKRHHIYASLVCGIVFSLLAGSLVSLRFSIRSAEQAKRAEEQAARADQQSKRADNEAAIAKQREAEARRLLGVTATQEGLRLADAGEYAAARCWFIESMARDPNNDDAHRTARMRIAAYDRYADSPHMKTLVTHEGGITKAVYSEDGSRLFVASQDGIARVWDAVSGKPISVELKHASPLRAFAVSSDGTKLATGCLDGTARVWDLTTGNIVGVPLKHGAEITTVHFANKDRDVIVLGLGQPARLWDWSTGKETPFGGESQRLKCASTVIPKMNLVALADYSGNFSFWNLETAQREGPVIKAGFHISGLTASDDGQWLIVWGLGGQLRVVNVKTRQLSGVHWKHSATLSKVVFSPDGLTFATGSWDRTARLWSLATGEPIGSPFAHQGSVQQLQFSPDGQWLATGSLDCSARVWDINTGKLVSSPLMHASTITALAFSPNGQDLLTASDDGTTRIWRLDLFKHLTQVFRGPPSSLQFDHINLADQFRYLNGNVLTSNTDQSVQFITPDDQPASPSWKEPSKIEFGAVAPNGRWIALGLTDGQVSVRDVKSGQLLFPTFKCELAIRVMQFTPDSQWLLIATQFGKVFLWETATGKLLNNLGDASSVTFTPDGAALLLARANGWVETLEWPSQKPINERFRVDHYVKSLIVSPSGNSVVTITDRYCRVWNRLTGKPITGELPHQDRAVSPVFSPDEKYLLWRPEMQSVQLWDLENDQPVFAPFKHRAIISVIRFSPNGEYILTAGWEGVARLWNAKTGEPASPELTHPNHVFMAEFSPDGKQFLIGCVDQFARLWDTATALPITPRLEQAMSVRGGYFFPNSNRFATWTINQRKMWELPNTDLPLDVLKHQSELQIGRVDGTGSIRQLSAKELKPLHEEFRRIGINARPLSADDHRRWYQQQAEIAFTMKHWFAAQTHYRELLKLKPDDDTVQRKLQQASQEHEREKLNLKPLLGENE